MEINNKLFYRTKNKKICQRICSFIIPKKYIQQKKILDTSRKIGLDPLRTGSWKVVHKAAEATGEFIGNKIANNIVNRNLESDENSRNVVVTAIPPDEMQKKLNELRQVL